MAGAIQGTSLDTIYQELGLESFKLRKWHKNLSFTFKLMKEKPPNYLINLVPKCKPTI